MSLKDKLIKNSTIELTSTLEDSKKIGRAHV